MVSRSPSLPGQDTIGARDAEQDREPEIMAAIQFNHIPYPLWRRLPRPLHPLAAPLLRPFYPVDADTNPPTTPRQMADYLKRWRLLPAMDEREMRRHLTHQPAQVELTRADTDPPQGSGPLRLPAQWEPVESVLLTWPVLYPPLWPLYAQMVAAIAPVAPLHVLVPRPTWASGIQLYIQEMAGVSADRVGYLYLPTDDIWVRDYGPFVGQDSDGQPAAVYAIFDPLPAYPQQLDDAMPRRWAAHQQLPACQLDLHAEGGNFWSDGAGTLIVSEHLFARHHRWGREAVMERLHRAFDFEKLIITPYLRAEETGHVDLLVKLADAQTVLVTESKAVLGINAPRVLEAASVFRRETNARGQPYRIIELPALPRYRNWGVYNVWRSYTNALTVNGRVLVPIYGEPADDIALKVYEHAMPDHEILPIDCQASINGGGAVHCLTREVYALRA